MERGFAVLAGGNPQALIRRGAGHHAWLIVLVVLSIAGAAEAKPRRRDAKTWFDRGVAAYKKGSFEAASEALGKSFGLERDVDTLFAWAQAERKLEHCDKAIDLYEKLLTFNLPAANKEAVEAKLAECRTQELVGDHKGEPSQGAPPAGSKPESTPGASGTGASNAEPMQELPRADHAPESPSRSAGRAWYKDPISLALVGTGAVATGVGIGFLASARSLDDDFKHATDYKQAEQLSHDAKSRGNIGLVATGVGGALVIGGVVWIVTHRHDATEQRTLTGWLAPGGGGLSLAGSF